MKNTVKGAMRSHRCFSQPTFHRCAPTPAVLFCRRCCLNQTFPMVHFLRCPLNPEETRCGFTGRSSDFLAPGVLPESFNHQWNSGLPDVNKQDYSSGYCPGLSPSSLFIRAAGRHVTDTCYVAKIVFSAIPDKPAGDIYKIIFLCFFLQ